MRSFKVKSNLKSRSNTNRVLFHRRSIIFFSSSIPLKGGIGLL